MTRRHIIVGDAWHEIRRLEASSVDMVLTSPPYYQLRNYAVAGQLGHEPTVTEWVDRLRVLADDLKRVLAPTGTLWLNLGDCYASHPRQGAPRKSLLLGPERVALALVNGGWRLRNKIIWQKTNPMPHSVSDRLTCTWEVIYVFSQQDHYYFDLDAIRVAHRSRARPRSGARVTTTREPWRGPNSTGVSGLVKLQQVGQPGHPLGKNPGDVLQLASSSYRGGHHATYPVGLVNFALRAGCPEWRCRQCHAPYRRPNQRRLPGAASPSPLPTCHCQAAAEPGLVLDPFLGAGTTALGAEALHRDWLGIELSADFAAEARARLREHRHRRGSITPPYAARGSPPAA